ncbi:MAG: UxaA family hydrolase [Bacillota bacterium]
MAATRFLGYARPDGSIGVRNSTAVMSAVMCANEVTEDIAKGIDGAIAVVHGHGCCQLPPDLALVQRTLINIGKNPNIANVILVSLGCEGVDPDAVAQELTAAGKAVEVIRIQEEGGTLPATERGRRVCEKWRSLASKVERASFDATELTIGIKCGSSDTTSGLICNPSVGRLTDRFVAEGGTVIFGETTEFIGAEHLLAQRGCTPEVKAAIPKIVAEMEERCLTMKVDMRTGQPTPGNIRGGLTTIEEKSLGAISKSGTGKIKGVLEYGERPQSKGLFIMDSPGREPELLTGLAASGCSIVLFTTGRGALQGHPVVPVIKITGNERTAQHLASHMDVDVSAALTRHASLDEMADLIWSKIVDVASGTLTKAEIHGCGRFMNIYVKGPII